MNWGNTMTQYLKRLPWSYPLFRLITASWNTIKARIMQLHCPSVGATLMNCDVTRWTHIINCCIRKLKHSVRYHCMGTPWLQPSPPKFCDTPTLEEHHLLTTLLNIKPQWFELAGKSNRKPAVKYVLVWALLSMFWWCTVPYKRFYILRIINKKIQPSIQAILADALACT